MSELFQPFRWSQVIVEPWSQNLSTTIWVVLMGFLVAAACGLVGNYLILRRMALVGDAISHSILPGLVVAFLALYKIRDYFDLHESPYAWKSLAMFIGAIGSALLTSFLIEIIHKKSRVKQDAAIGIAFSSLFALGVVLITLFAGQVDLDQECVLYGEIAFVPLEPMVTLFGLPLGPEPVVQMGAVLICTAVLIMVFFKELLVSSFDPGLAASLGINATFVHYALMTGLSVVVVSAFESVGAILVIAMLILPGATASMLTYRLWMMHLLAVIHAAFSSLIGFHLAVWLDCSTAGAMVVAATALFVLAWLFSPREGLIRRLIPGRTEQLEPEFSINDMKNSG